MPSLVNRVPPGLLSLLGIKALGVNPSVLQDDLEASLDVTDLYYVGNSEEIASQTSAINAVGAWPISTPLLVPSGELWVVTRAACWAANTLLAGTTYRCRLGIYNGPTTRTVLVGESFTGTAGERPAGSFQTWPVILTPSEQLAVWCESVTLGTAAQFAVVARVTKLQI